MIATNHLSQDELALFALQLLPAAEAQTALAHMRECAECRAGVANFQGDMAILAFAAEEQTPSAAARQRLLNAVSAEKSSVPFPSSVASNVVEMKPREAAPKRINLIAWTGWAVAAALAIAAGLQFQQRRQAQTELSESQAHLAALQQAASSSEAAVSALTGPGALKVSLHQPTDPSARQPHPEGQAAYLPDRGALVFVATNLEPLKPYKVYELWLLPSTKGAAPIPAASFRPDAAGSANVILPAGPRLISIAGFGVTEEDDKTAPKAPTLPILLLGTSRT